MSTTFKAIQKLKYLKPSPVFVLHSRVKELHPEQTKAAVAFNQKLNADNRPDKYHLITFNLTGHTNAWIVV